MTNLKTAVIESIQDQGDKAEQKTYMEEVMTYGCISGMVGGLIYYTDTVAYYKEHEGDILDLLEALKEDTGLNERELFGDEWESLEDLAEDFEGVTCIDDYPTQEEYEEAQEEEWAEFYESLDPLESTYNQNLLAWFGYEETLKSYYESLYGEY